jgi:hemolysin activation/secretion protein
MGRTLFARLLLGLIAMMWPGSIAYGQLPSLDPTLRSGDQPQLQREEPRPGPGPVLPPIVPPPIVEPRVPFPAVRVHVREIRVEGSTVFSSAELAKVTARYVNRELSAEDLEALRRELTLLYVNSGYVNSGAILPDQAVADGVVKYEIVEGRLTDIDVDGNRWFRSRYFRARLGRAARPPLDVNRLQRELQVLLEDPRLRRLSAEVKPGVRPGEALLDLMVEEEFPLKLWLDVNNYQAPSVGAERGILTLEHQNLTGNGDIITLRFGKSSGLDPLLDFRYAIPVTPVDTSVSFQYRKNTFAVVEEPFSELDIENESEIFTVGVRQPLYRTSATELALELIGERLSNNTTLFGEPFSLEPGARNGETIVAAARAALQIVHRSQNQVIAARSRFSVGVDALGSTVHERGLPDSRFFAWLGQFQWVRRLAISELPQLSDTQLILRSDVQLADDALLTLEQIAVGGRYSVRGYRENTMVRDNAVLASLEARVPIVQNQPWADYVQLAPFFDYGRAWQSKGRTGEPRYISSVGIGLRWALSLRGAVPVRPSFEVYWGHALQDVETAATRRDIQDEGVHFQFVLGLF